MPRRQLVCGIKRAGRKGPLETTQIVNVDLRNHLLLSDVVIGTAGSNLHWPHSFDPPTSALGSPPANPASVGHTAAERRRRESTEGDRNFSLHAACGEVAGNDDTHQSVCSRRILAVSREHTIECGDSSCRFDVTVNLRSKQCTFRVQSRAVRRTHTRCNTAADKVYVSCILLALHTFVRKVLYGLHVRQYSSGPRGLSSKS